MMENEPLVVWDADFQPFVVKDWEVESRLDRLEKALWERQCYRPGTARYPMDRYGAS